MKNDFNSVAPIYDRLARLVFGHKLEKSQRCFLDDIHAGARVLIVGGGTGRVLEWLPHGGNLSVTYVELSTEMMRYAEKRNQQDSHVVFHRMDVHDITGTYDFVIANFFLDCFDVNGLKAVLKKMTTLMDKNGKLLVTDFSPATNIWQSGVLKLMHLFFQLTTKLASRSLQDLNLAIVNNGFLIRKEELFANRLIFSAVYKKV